MSNTSTKPSALDALKSLANKKPAPAAAISVQVNDPAIAGAKKVGSTVTLGFDPSITERAKYCSSLKEALEKAESEFAVLQGEMRDYGINKRGLYNDTFKANITTVKVPFTIEVPGGNETKVVAVICSNKYSVQKDVVLNNKDTLGEAYERLFVEERAKKLKPNAEELIRGILSEVGLDAEQVETSMQNLFEEEVKVKTTENYEQEAKKLPDPLKLVLDQAVTRSSPGLKFD